MSLLPDPEPGLVIPCFYLWRHKQRHSDQKESRKVHPCGIVLAVEQQEKNIMVTVAPVTYHVPDTATSAMELPTPINKYLGFDQDRAWIMLDEVNQFAWPGCDVQPIPGSKNCYIYGLLPPKLFERIKAEMLARIVTRRAAQA